MAGVGLEQSKSSFLHGDGCTGSGTWLIEGKMPMEKAPISPVSVVFLRMLSNGEGEMSWNEVSLTFWRGRRGGNVGREG
jgi:hypothetical protein